MVGKWICYKGDWEIYLAEKVQTRRFQRDFPIAPFWRVDSPYHNVRFTHTFTLNVTLEVTVLSRQTTPLKTRLTQNSVWNWNTLTTPRR